MLSSLSGKKIVVTRAEHQAAELAGLLLDRGALPLAYPCIQIVPPVDVKPLHHALIGLAQDKFDGLVLTSVNTVDALRRQLSIVGLDTGIFSRLKVVCIGPATAEAARTALDVEIHLIPEEYVAESLIAASPFQRGERVLLPRAETARPILADGLQNTGVDLTMVTAYRTLPDFGGVDLPDHIRKHAVDAITLSSSSTAQYFVQRFVSEGGTLNDLRAVRIACIGPITAETAVRIGLQVDIIASQYTMVGLVTALEDYYSNERKNLCI